MTRIIFKQKNVQNAHAGAKTPAPGYPSRYSDEI